MTMTLETFDSFCSVHNIDLRLLDEKTEPLNGNLQPTRYKVKNICTVYDISYMLYVITQTGEPWRRSSPLERQNTDEYN